MDVIVNGKLVFRGSKEAVEEYERVKAADLRGDTNIKVSCTTQNIRMTVADLLETGEPQFLEIFGDKSYQRIKMHQSIGAHIGYELGKKVRTRRHTGSNGEIALEYYLADESFSQKAKLFRSGTYVGRVETTIREAMESGKEVVLPYTGKGRLVTAQNVVHKVCAALQVRASTTRDEAAKALKIKLIK